MILARGSWPAVTGRYGPEIGNGQNRSRLRWARIDAESIPDGPAAAMGGTFSAMFLYYFSGGAA